MHTHTATSTAGLLLSLSSELPRSSPLARKARRLASRLGHGASTEANARAVDLLARLLAASDAAGLYPEDGVLDTEFDD